MRGSANAETLQGIGKPEVPLRALVLSGFALVVPLVGSVFPLEIEGVPLDLLIWLPALLPAFLLTYYRGWGGASVALAAGMATLTISQSVIFFVVDPSTQASSDVATVGLELKLLMPLVVAFVAICLAVGWFGELMHRARRQAEHAALSDPLTGLPNRGHLTVFLDSAFGAAERGGTLTVIIWDLDRFKRINDEYGHHAGDETLVVFADMLRTQTRRSDLSARFGGEEFVSILTGPGGAPGARVFAERVRDQLRDYPFQWSPVTASAGIAEYSHDIPSPDLLLGEADRALYHAKGTGRDRVVMSVELAGKGPAGENDAPSRDGAEGASAEEGDRGGGQEPAAEPDPAGQAGARKSKKKREPHILIVDDDAFMREGLGRVLKRSGFRTTSVEDGVTALAMLELDVEPDLVLSDLVMPGMGGLTLADRIGQRHPGVRVLLVSGYDHGEVMGNVPAAVVGFLQKPLTPPQLVGAVRDLVEGGGDEDGEDRRK